MNALFIPLFLLGILFFLPLANIKSKENRCSSYTKGTVSSVTRQIQKKGFRKKTLYFPTVSFEADGKTINILYQPTPDENEYHAGDSFWVMYNPQNPHEVYQDDDLQMLKVRIIAAIGILIMGFTVFSYPVCLKKSACAAPKAAHALFIANNSPFRRSAPGRSADRPHRRCIGSLPWSRQGNRRWYREKKRHRSDTQSPTAVHRLR